MFTNQFNAKEVKAAEKLKEIEKEISETKKVGSDEFKIKAVDDTANAAVNQYASMLLS